MDEERSALGTASRLFVYKEYFFKVACDEKYSVTLLRVPLSMRPVKRQSLRSLPYFAIEFSSNGKSSLMRTESKFSPFLLGLRTDFNVLNPLSMPDINI